MPTVSLNKKVFEKLVGKKLPISKLKDRISMLGTDLESIEGDEIKVEVFPNRPDMLSEQGFARAFSSFIGIKTGLREYKVKKSGYKVYVKDLPKEWPYAVACVVKGLKFNDEKIREVIQLQEKLGTTLTRNRRKGGIGLYPLEKITFPVSFIGKRHEQIKFRPLEFPSVINANQILQKHPKGKEYGYIMERWKRYPVFIDSKGIFMSMPPIINSHDVGKIDETTRDVFIECTGTDLNVITKSLCILATSLAEMGGEIHSIEMVYPNKKLHCPDLKPTEMRIDLNYINKYLGLSLKESEMKKLLERMGYGYYNKKVLVPAYRTDVMHQVDFAEDMAIAYGYENFVEEIPNVMTLGEEDKFEVFKDKVAEIMVGLGYIECYTYHLIGKEKQTKQMNFKTDMIVVENPVSEGYESCRYWIIPSLMQVLKDNKHHELPHKIFDIGIAFKKDSKTETRVREATRLAVLHAHETAGYTEARQILDYLMRMLGLKYTVKETEHSSFIPGRVGRVSVKGKDVAYIGEIHPLVLKNWELGVPVAGFELNLSDLFEMINL